MTSSEKRWIQLRINIVNICWGNQSRCLSSVPDTPLLWISQAATSPAVHNEFCGCSLIIKGIVHQKMKFIIIYLLSCCSKPLLFYFFLFTCRTQRVLSTQECPCCSFLYNESEWWKCYFFLSNIFKTILSSDKNKKILYGFWKHQVSYMGYFMVIFKLESTCAPFIFTVCNIKAQPCC